LNPDGTVDVDTVLWSNFNGDNPAVYRFGDFAINRDGELYASTNDTGGSTAEFFKLDVETGEYTLIADDTTPNAALLLQVSFGSDGTLYGHSAGSGEFFTIDLTTGVKTSIGYVESDYREHELFSDLASGTQPRFYDFHNTPTLYCFDETAWAALGEPGVTRFVTPPGNWATWIGQWENSTAVSGYNVGDGTEGDPVVFPLYAGQTYYAGDLLVGDDGDILYVKYVASGEAGDYEVEGICQCTWTGLTEYHLQVVDEFADFEDYRVYNNKKGYGAPIPGQFDVGWEGDKVAETDPAIEVGISGLWATENEDLFIAAHAVMWWCGYDCDVLQEIEDAQNGD
jgi:hypothetical protein